jgi:hypothetical protein
VVLDGALFEDILYPELAGRATRHVFLITYAQASAQYTKEAFSNIIVEAFRSKGNITIEKWVCSRENHLLGGFHFHMAVKVFKQRRWATIKRSVESTYPDIKLHFSQKPKDDGDSYDGAYNYVIKGGDFVLSQNHPTVTTAPLVEKHRET